LLDDFDEEEDNNNALEEDETSQMLLPFEVLIEQRHHSVFFQAWDLFGYRLKYQELARLLTLILGSNSNGRRTSSKDWLCEFLERPVTRQLFENLNVQLQIDFVERILQAFSLEQQQTKAPEAESPVKEALQPRQTEGRGEDINEGFEDQEINDDFKGLMLKEDKPKFQLVLNPS
jgi:hypothetical protein